MMDPPTFFRRVVYIAHLRILYFNITFMAGGAQLFIRFMVISFSYLSVHKALIHRRAKTHNP
ncbi:hypothetical protein EKN81_16285 [Enterobacter asburiae]|nr:hypothetical protein F0321_00245 [Enterobacter asburiae]KAA0530815.1 hypothetical protein F0320_17515 [Enterobacter dykesii]RTN77472.1 hypothetical protein EKN81_16285 [Enterobacter asburiae]RTP76252.1 hypothetical protein EKN32_17395 [Enterobacter asburiae]